jgi:hypothetical protein
MYRFISYTTTCLVYPFITLSRTRTLSRTETGATRVADPLWWRTYINTVGMWGVRTPQHTDEQLRAICKPVLPLGAPLAQTQAPAATVEAPRTSLTLDADDPRWASLAAQLRTRPPTPRPALADG